MKNTFKKITASVMAVASLVVSMTSFSANAVAEPRYGGSRTFTVYKYTATATIEKSSTFGYATTSCDGETIGYLYARISVGSLTDMAQRFEPGIVTIRVYSSASTANSYHVARTVTGTEGNTSMAA